MRFIRGLRVALLVALAAVLMIQLSPSAAASPSLSAPTLTSPSDNALVSATPTFTWTSVSGADNYELQYSTDAGFPSASTVGVHDIRDNSVEAGVSDGTYYWRVRGGKDNGEVGPWSSVWAFTLDTTAPGEAGLTSPENGAYLDNATVSLDWTDVTGAENYTVLVDNDENFTSPVINKVASESAYVTSTLSDEEYYWKITARDLAGNENQTSARTFIVDTQPPNTPDLHAPSNGSHTNDSTSTLDWANATDSVGLAKCEVWVDNSLEKLMENQTTDDIENFATTHELSDGSHIWHVVLTDHAGHESTSSTWRFVVDTVSPSVPSKSGPQDGMMTPVTAVTFSWSASTDNLSSLANYELWIDDDPSFGSPAMENSTDNDQVVSLSDGNYSWRVRAWDAAGNSSDFENSWTLLIDTTDPDTPSLLWPAENVVENTSTPQFRWVSVDDPSGETYEIRVATDNAFWDWSIVYDKAGITENEHDVENILQNRYSDNRKAGPFYYWRVRATDNLGHVGEWSDNLPFMVLMRDFAVSITPSSDRVAQGGYTSVTVTLSKIGRYENSVDLSISGTPSGVSYIFDRMGPPPLNATAVISASESASPGSYTLTVMGVDANGWERTATYSLEVFVPPTVTIQEISAGEQRTVAIGEANVTQVVIGAQNQIQNATISVEALDQEPTGAPALEGQVHSYIKIDTENIGSADIGSLKIQFCVEKSWIQQNNLDVSKIRLNRYSAGGWQELTTSNINEDGIYIYYSAQSSGFSTFAITGEEKKPSPSGWLTDWRFLTAVGILVAVAALVVWRKRAQPEEKWKEEAAEEGRPPGEKPPEKEEKPPREEEDIWM